MSYYTMQLIEDKWIIELARNMFVWSLPCKLVEGGCSNSAFRSIQKLRTRAFCNYFEKPFMCQTLWHLRRKTLACPKRTIYTATLVAQFCAGTVKSLQTQKILRKTYHRIRSKRQSKSRLLKFLLPVHSNLGIFTQRSKCSSTFV